MDISYEKCNICPRSCGVDRVRGELGYCASPSVPHVVRVAPHMWEEPIISGTRGSGTVFFSGCSLRCSYCQNYEISRSPVGEPMTAAHLAKKMLDLERAGVHNINFVTPTHFAPSVISATRLARDSGLKIPIVYNTSSYERRETVAALSDTVDVYLADMKYFTERTAGKLSAANDYPRVAKTAIAEMVRHRPIPVISDGIMLRGCIIRILLLPGHVAEAKLAAKYIYDTYGDSVYISLMSQYTPIPDMPPPLDRRVSRAEYRELTDYALRLGIKNAFVQEHSAASAAYIPDFNV